MDSFYTLVNILLYCLLFFHYSKRYRSINPGHIVLIAWMFIALMGLFYVNSGSVYRNYKNEVSILPFIAEFILFLIAFFPFYRFKWDTPLKINDKPIVKFLIIFIIGVSIPPFVESISLLLSPELTIANTVEEYQTRDEQEATILLSFFANKCYHFSSAFHLVSPILLFYYLTKKKPSFLIVSGLLMASLVTCVYGLALGNRGPAVSTFLYISFLFFLFKRNFSDKIKKNIIKMGLGILSIASVYLLLMSMLRFEYIGLTSDNNSTLGEWIVGYLGEPFINMNRDSFWNENYLWGELSLPFPYDLLTGTIPRDRWTLANVVRIRTHVFYTSFGQLFIDFPYIIVFFLAGIQCTIMNVLRLFARHSLGALIIWIGFSFVLLDGIFINPLLNNFLAFVFTIFTGLIVCFSPKNSYHKGNKNDPEYY